MRHPRGVRSFWFHALSRHQVRTSAGFHYRAGALARQTIVGSVHVRGTFGSISAFVFEDRRVVVMRVSLDDLVVLAFAIGPVALWARHSYRAVPHFGHHRLHE